MNIKAALSSPKFHQLLNTLITAVATYFGISVYQGSSVASVSPDVDVQVHVPDTANKHSHPVPKQTNWKPAIKSEIDKSIKAHIDAYH